MTPVTRSSCETGAPCPVVLLRAVVSLIKNDFNTTAPVEQARGTEVGCTEGTERKRMSRFSKLSGSPLSRCSTPAPAVAERMLRARSMKWSARKKLLGPGKPLRVQSENDDLGSCFSGGRRCGRPRWRRLSRGSRVPNSLRSARCFWHQ